MTKTYQLNSELHHTLREQLRLFAFDDEAQVPSDLISQMQKDLSKRERLETLLQGELDFHGEDSGYASHDLHAFAAKFPPQLPRAFIRGLTNRGDTILDPMVGSGTTIVESLLEGRVGIGLDIDPLAIQLCRVKTTLLDIAEVKKTGAEVVFTAKNSLREVKNIDQGLNNQFDPKTKDFIDYWFNKETQLELLALSMAISQVQNMSIRHFLELTYSSIIVTKSGGVTKARDLAHSRPHLDKTKNPKDAIEQFISRLRKNIDSLAQLKQDSGRAYIINTDARCIPIANETVDLIVTSPPYANAIDYMRAHKFSLVWFGKPINMLSELRAKYIGSERVGNAQFENLPINVENVVQELYKRDKKKSAVLRKYYGEMKLVLAEMYRILRKDCPAIVVVGTSTIRELDIQTHTCLTDIASELGFQIVGITKRILDRNKRMMPARFGKKSDSMIEQRMHDEFVIGLLKPS